MDVDQKLKKKGGVSLTEKHVFFLNIIFFQNFSKSILHVKFYHTKKITAIRRLIVHTCIGYPLIATIEIYNLITIRTLITCVINVI